MTREEANKELERAFDVLDHSCHMDNRRKEAFNMARVALSEEPCEDCVSRKKALAEFKRIYFDNETVVRCAELVLGGLPSIQPKPKTGHWKKLNVGYGCSECSLATNKSGVDFYRFCPNCGAKIESENKE